MINSFWRWTMSPGREVFPADKQASTFEKCQLSVQLFYIVLFLHAAGRFGEHLKAAAVPPKLNIWVTNLFQWPLSELTTMTVACLFLVSTMSAALFFRYRISRIAAHITLLLFWAMIDTADGYIEHGRHFFFLLSFVFIFLPKASRDNMEDYNRTFWAGLLLVLLTYTCSGVCKILGGFYDVLGGGYSILSLESMSLHLASNWYRVKETPFGPYLLMFPRTGQLLFLMAIFMELVSVVIAFRPTLHRFWAFCLITFHAAVNLTFGISFLEAGLILGVTLYISPFHRPVAWQAAIRDFPVFGNFLYLLLVLLRRRHIALVAIFKNRQFSILGITKRRYPPSRP